MKIIPRVVGTTLILALANLSFINLALASSARSPKVIAPSPVSNSAGASYSEPVPQPSPPPHATKNDIKQDLDDTATDLHTLIGTDPNGFAANLLSQAGLDPFEDITDTKNAIDALSDEDFTTSQGQFDTLHKKAQKRRHHVASILSNPTLMALLHRPSPIKFRFIVDRSGAASPFNEKGGLGVATRINPALSKPKSSAAQGAFTKGLASLNVTVLPEMTRSCTPGDGIPGGVNDLMLVKAITLAAEAVKEAIPDDTIAVVPHGAAVIVWTAAKIAEFVMESLHAVYLECSSVQAEAKVNDNLDSIKTTVGGINSHTTTTINSTKTEINTFTDSIKTAIITKIGDTANTTSTAINNSTTTITGSFNTALTSTETNITNNNTINRNLIINNLTDLSLRLLVEADLSAPDSATPMAIFVTPGSKGGHLELVRSILLQTITNLAGASTSQANSFLAQGDAYKAAGNFKSAYASYRKAYKAATN